jgi:hypothetical protein
VTWIAQASIRRRLTVLAIHAGRTHTKVVVDKIDTHSVIVTRLTFTATRLFVALRTCPAAGTFTLEFANAIDTRAIVTTRLRCTLVNWRLYTRMFTK